MPLRLHLYSPMGAEGLLSGTIHSHRESESYHGASGAFQHVYLAEFCRDGSVLFALHPWRELGEGSEDGFPQHTECPSIGSHSRTSYAGTAPLGIFTCFRYYPSCLPPASTAHLLGGHEMDQDLQLGPGSSP